MPWDHCGQQISSGKTKHMHISTPKTGGKLSLQHKRAALWVSSDPQRDANKFTSEKYYVLFYFSQVSTPSVWSSPGESVTSSLKP